MQRALQRLSALTVERAKAPGYLHDGGGLYLQVTAVGGKSWIFRYALGGRRPDRTKQPPRPPSVASSP